MSETTLKRLSDETLRELWHELLKELEKRNIIEFNKESSKTVDNKYKKAYHLLMAHFDELSYDTQEELNEDLKELEL